MGGARTVIAFRDRAVYPRRSVKLASRQFSGLFRMRAGRKASGFEIRSAGVRTFGHFNTRNRHSSIVQFAAEALIEIAGEIFTGRINLLKIRVLVQIRVIEFPEGRLHGVLNHPKIDTDSLVVERFGMYNDCDGPIMPMQPGAVTRIVA